ncbi:MAG: cofactor-independent phosphoglycerate mutase [Candidatus Bathyarchaeia archaeon]|jgi:2,3-bisphosphoglycerate-independent phosphoglycerate mutase
MKYVVVLGDGMADYPVPQLGNKTPLQTAYKPNMDRLVAKGCSGLLKTVPENMTPGSGTAILSVLGYDPQVYYTGRGPFEAAARNIVLNQNDVAYRCNLITEQNGKILDHSAGHITNGEAEKLINAVKNRFEKYGEVEFFAGLSYRHFLILRNYVYSEVIECTPPHDVIGWEVSKVLPQAKTEQTKRVAELLTQMILDSKPLLSNHPVNVARRKAGKHEGNMIWPWDGGKKPSIPTFKSRYGLSGAVISAVDLVKGIGFLADMKVIEVEGATGLYDTNYEGKAEAALDALKDVDFVFVHVEAPDEAGHCKDYALKVRTIEDLDKRLLGNLLDGLPEDCTIAVLPDHPTPITVGTHTRDAVPFVIGSPDVKPDKVTKFDEDSTKNGGYGCLGGEEFMRLLLNNGVKSD